MNRTFLLANYTYLFDSEEYSRSIQTQGNKYILSRELSGEYFIYMMAIMSSRALLARIVLYLAARLQSDNPKYCV